MARHRMDYNLLSLSANSTESILSEFNNLDEVSAKLLYTDILKAVKQVILDEKIDCLINLSQVLHGINNYQHNDGIGNFNLVTLACKNKAIVILEYIFSEETQTLYNLSVNLTGVSENELFSAKDEFCHDAFYYAIRSNMPHLLNILADKWQSQYSDEDLDDLLSKSYKELKLRNVSLTREMQLFVQSKILDLRFFHESTGGNSGTGNSWDQIKKRIEMVVRYAKSINYDYWDRDPDEKFIFIAEFIAKSIHVLKSLLKSTYDRLPWEEIEFCLIIFIRCCKSSPGENMVYNCVLNKKRLLMHLFNFSLVLDTQHDKFENSNVMQLAKNVKLPRDCVIKRIIEKNSEFRDLYDDFEKVRDVCSLDMLQSYSDSVESSDATVGQRYLLVSRVLQVMGEHLKNTIDSPKLSTTTAKALFSSLSSKAKDIITKLRNSLSHEESICIRSDIEKNAYLFKNIPKDISRIKGTIPYILYTMKIVSLKSLMKKLESSRSIEEMKECYGQHLHSRDLCTKEIEKINLSTLIKGDCERLEELLLCLDEHIRDKAISEKILFVQIYYLIRREKERFENLKQVFYHNVKSVLYLNLYVSSENYSCDFIRTMAEVFGSFAIEAPSGNIEQIGELFKELIKRVVSRIFPSRNTEVNDILWKIAVFLTFEMGSVIWIEEFRDSLSKKANRVPRLQRLGQNSSEYLRKKLSQLIEVWNYDLRSGPFRADFSYFESNMELRVVTEMLVLDILGLLESSCSRNPFFIDCDLPVLTGKNLRNHLAHENTLINVCLEESSSQLLLNVQKLLNDKALANNNNKIDRVIKCDCMKLESSFDDDLRIISNQQKLFDALREGNLKEVVRCVNEGADVYGKDCNSSTCLHFAAKAPASTFLESILKADGYNSRNVDINSRNVAGEVLLHIAAKFNRIEVVRYLVEEQHMSLDICDSNGKTPLHVAVENQSNETVNYISKFEINLARKDRNGFTPLHTAIFRNNIDAAKILLKKEANVDENKSHGNFTALHIATLSKNLYFVEMLISRKASVYFQSDMGDTPLHIATLTEHLEIVEALVRNGADVNAKNEAGITSLENAAEMGCIEIVGYLLQLGADINDSDCRGITPLMVAAKYGHLSVTNLLLQRGALVDSKDKFGLTPLHFAAERGHFEIVDLLLHHKVIIDCKNSKKETALHLSATHGHKEVVKLLIKEETNINATQSTNSTPLHLAVSYGHKDIVDLLIDEGADINCKDESGSTALHHAALNADRGMVESLLRKGADIRASDANEITPFYLLFSRGLSDLFTPEDRDVYSSDGHGFTLLHRAASAGDQTLVEY
ncbi:Putative ankyrin repeat protein RF_0381 [Araneus ventricosus]|uniref:Ankyrin repeat protein RF_0381 n=1 Tax=Araneus ventricosus TaxID=182803 RepID=A0A4Y2NQE4_ARAVE|nr:Putative ankyrin repeat protein RF_0381 [Araneus ventricosus]